MKNVLFGLAAAILSAGCFSHPSLCDATSGATRTCCMKKLVDVGNKICPVLGTPVGDSIVVCEYNGKIYHLCCTDCVAKFKVSPDKYATIADNEARAAGKTACGTR